MSAQKPRLKPILSPPLMMSPTHHYYSTQSFSPTGYNSVISSPTKGSCQTSVLLDASQVDFMKKQIQELYLEIQSLNSLKNDLMQKHKDKYLKTNQTEQLIVKEQRQIDEKLKGMQVRAELEVKINEVSRQKFENQVLQVQKENQHLADTLKEIQNQIHDITWIQEEIQSEKDEDGHFKYQNKQVEIHTESQRQVDEQIELLNANKAQILEQNAMTLEDAASHVYRIQDFTSLLAWKQSKVDNHSQKVSNQKSKLYQTLQIEQQSIDEWRTFVDTLQKVVIPSLMSNSQILEKIVGDLDARILQLLTQKTAIIQSINESKSVNTLYDECQGKIAVLLIRKEHLQFKQVELQEKMRLNTQKIQIIHDQMSQQQQKLKDFIAQVSQQIQNLDSRQKQLIDYQNQMINVVKPSLTKMDNKIQNITKTLEEQKFQMIKMQKKLNSQSIIKDYQQLSSPNSHFQDYKQYTDDDITECYTSEQHMNIQVQSSSRDQTAEEFIKTPSAQIQPQIVLEDVDKNAQELSQSEDSEVVCFAADDYLIAFNNPDLFFRVLPLFRGIEVYKKQFDTKLLNLTQQHKYNPLLSNKRVTPDQLGYQLRVAAINANDIGYLEFLNPHEDIPRAEVKIDFKQAKIHIPKFSSDSLKYQKEEKQPLRQLNQQYLSNKSQPDTFKARKNSFIQQEQDDYKLKCLGAQYFSMTIIYKDKEYDILISNAGGYFNFEIFRKAVEALQSLTKREKVRIEDELSKRQ